jgi:hypothetical protein
MQQESWFCDMRYCDSIIAIESRMNLDHWFNSVSEFRESQYGETKETKQLELQICDMRNREIALCIRMWSQPLVMGREGASLDKLHIGVLGIATSRGKNTNAEMLKPDLKAKLIKLIQWRRLTGRRSEGYCSMA